MEQFIVEIDGIEKTANIVARLELESTGVEYIYYYVEDEVDSNGENYLFAGRVEEYEDGEQIIEIESEEERKIAFEMFSTTYKEMQD